LTALEIRQAVCQNARS